MSDSAIEVHGLGKRYGKLHAVQQLSLEVRRGEVFALLGPNGAGKTTTVEILEGYRDRDEGSVTVLGTDPSRLRGRADREWRTQIGIVAQTSSERLELTVEEILRHFARYYPAPRDVDEVIEAAGLSEKRTARILSLSGGQRRRLDVALGIIGDPELLFLDEPTTGFDPQARRAFWELIAGLRTGGTTILLTTHYLDEAEHLADRVGVIARGRLLEVNTPDRLGGRSERASQVRWLDGDRERTEITRTPTALVTSLSARFAAPGEFAGEVPGLQIARPSLEDVYLSMIEGSAS